VTAHDPTPRDSLRALVEAGKAATPGSWWDDAHFDGDGSVVMGDGYRQAHLPGGMPLHAENAAFIAASRKLTPALAEVVLSLSPEDEGMVERVAEVLHKSLCPNRCLYVERPVPHARLARAVLSALRTYADEKIGEAL